MSNSPSPPPSAAHSQSLPYGIFWDVENIQVPSDQSAITIANTIGGAFMQRSEAVFHVAGNAEIIPSRTIYDLMSLVDENGDGIVDFHNIEVSTPNAADNVLKEKIQNFKERYSRGIIILLSGDGDFQSEIGNSNYHYIIIHSENVNRHFQRSVDEAFTITEFCDTDVVSNLPSASPSPSPPSSPSPSPPHTSPSGKRRRTF